MEGKQRFTRTEIAEIRQLLLDLERSRGDKNKCKSIRQSLRNKGFYITDFDQSQSGFTAAKLDQLIKIGSILAIN